MEKWLDRRIQSLFGIELPIIQAPMAGSNLSELVIAVSEAGGLGSLPCAMLGEEQMRGELGAIRRRTSKPFNANFFCHTPPTFRPGSRFRLAKETRAILSRFRTGPDGAIPGFRAGAVRPGEVRYRVRIHVPRS